jgi:enoyl-CoA hydratase
MRYILTGDHWSADEAYRMGEVQEVAPNAKEALDAGIRIANKIADCGPLGIQTSLASAHLVIDHTEEEALSNLDAQFGALFHTQDFLEGRKAEAEDRKSVYHGNKARIEKKATRIDVYLDEKSVSVEVASQAG